MGLPSTGSVILVRFPFSNLSQVKLRPAVVLADAGRGVWILYQVTSNTFSDLAAVEILLDDLQSGSLKRTSYARPSKLFTCSLSLIVAEVGVLNPNKLDEILQAIIRLFQSSLQS